MHSILYCNHLKSNKYLEALVFTPCDLIVFGRSLSHCKRTKKELIACLLSSVTLDSAVDAVN